MIYLLLPNFYPLLLLTTCFLGHFLVHFLCVCRYDTPDYTWMKSKIDEAMFERNYTMDYAFDWGNRVLPKKKIFGLF